MADDTRLMTTESTEVNQLDESDILVHLTEWRAQVSDGPRNRGEAYSARFSVVALTNCWAITEYRSTGAYSHQVFASSFADLCCFFKTVASGSIRDGIAKCAEALEARTGLKRPELVDDTVRACLAYAHRVDEVYATDYALHADVRSRIFKGEDGE